MTAGAGAAYEAAARQALARFGLEGAELRFVLMSENVTFRATDPRDGSRFVLRLHRPWYHDIAALKSEHLWTRALLEAGVSVPVPLRTADGEEFVQVDIPAMDEQRWAGLARWVEGELLSEVLAREADHEATAAHFARLGAIMAAVHNQAAGWTPPPGFRRHALDADGLMGPAPFWGPFWEHGLLSPDERSLLLATRDRLHAALTRYGKAGHAFSMIHSDLHARNVLVDGARTAVIDFDDAAFGWHQYDLAAALAAYQRQPAFPTIRDACIAGYRSVRALSEQDLALLPMFLLIRSLASIGWYHQRPELTPSMDLPQLKAHVCATAAGFVPPC
ncbi:homoserine kinase [Allostella vacuolata]|nr:homoserine kinase [Stella vacuolata]